jgi:hypothetical protein
MRKLGDALCFMLGLMGITIVDADASSGNAMEARHPVIQEDDRVQSELTKAREDGPYCFIIHTQSDFDSLKHAALPEYYGGKRCSRSLRSS